MAKRDEAAWKALLIDLELAGKNDPLLSMARTLASRWRELPPPHLRESSLFWLERGRRGWALQTGPQLGGGWWINAYGPQVEEALTATALTLSAAAEIIRTLVRTWSAEAKAQR
jgi:hypothetical protein